MFEENGYDGQELRKATVCKNENNSIKAFSDTLKAWRNPN